MSARVYFVNLTGDLEIVRGDDYTVEDLYWTSNAWPDLTGAAISVTIRNRKTDEVEVSTTGEVVTPTGYAKVAFALPSALSSLLAIRDGNIPGGKFDIEATLADGRRRTLVRGRTFVAEDQTR